MPVFQFVVSFGEAEGGLGLWSRKVPALGQIIAGSPWVEVDERLWDPSDSLLIKKWPSVFAGTPLAALLNAQRIDTVIVTGCTTSGCVRASVVDAFSNGFLTLVPEDAVGDQAQGAARREPARLPAALRRGHDHRRLHRVPAAPRRRMRKPPLEDVTIVAIEQYGAGPWGSVQLADLGADVIKIEDPRSRGDVGRYVPPFQEGEDSLFFETFCHNKRSVSLDLTHPEARPVFEDIVRSADAVYSNLRGDGPEKLRIRYADLAERQPGDRVLLALGLRHDRAARRGGRLRLHPAGLRGLDVAHRRARRPAGQDGALARRHGHRLRRGAGADVRAVGARGATASAATATSPCSRRR